MKREMTLIIIIIIDIYRFLTIKELLLPSLWLSLSLCFSADCLISDQLSSKLFLYKYWHTTIDRQAVARPYHIFNIPLQLHIFVGYTAKGCQAGVARVLQHLKPKAFNCIAVQRECVCRQKKDAKGCWRMQELQVVAGWLASWQTYITEAQCKNSLEPLRK